MMIITQMIAQKIAQMIAQQPRPRAQQSSQIIQEFVIAAIVKCLAMELPLSRQPREITMRFVNDYGKGYLSVGPKGVRNQ